jgi:hypothetical protein
LLWLPSFGNDAPQIGSMHLEMSEVEMSVKKWMGVALIGCMAGASCSTPQPALVFV